MGEIQSLIFTSTVNGKCVLNPKNGITDFDRSPHILMGSEFHETLSECGHVAPTNSTRWPSLEVTAKVELILKNTPNMDTYG